MRRLRECLGNVRSARELNAFVSVRGSAELEAAAAAAQGRLDAGAALGALDGKVVALKANFCTTFGTTTAGSRMLADFRAPYDATVAARLEAAGAVLIGKTNMDEFGMGSFGVTSAHGPTLRPATRDGVPRVAGGSSSGSAAAVAADCCDVAIGSDTGGSVRLPAAFCGVYGFKPSYGRISRWGLIAYASSLDTPGVLARRARDLAHTLAAVAGADPLDSTCLQEPWPPATAEVELEPKSKTKSKSNSEPEAGPSKRLRIGIPSEYHVAELPTEVAAQWEDTARRIQRALGGEADVELVPVSVPAVRDALPAYYVIACAEAASNLARYDGVQFGLRAGHGDAAMAAMEVVEGNLHAEFTATRSEGFGAEVQRRLLMGSFVLSSGAYDDYYVRATRVRATLAAEFAAAFRDSCDFMLTPVSTTGAGAPSLEGVRAKAKHPVDAFLADIMTVPSSLAGLPCVAAPVADRDGQSIQLIAPKGEDARLLRLTERLEDEGVLGCLRASANL